MKEIISDRILKLLQIIGLPYSNETAANNWLFPDVERNDVITNREENNVLYLRPLSHPLYCMLFPIEIGKKKIFILRDVASDYILGYFGKENFLDNPEEHLINFFKKLVELKNTNLFIYSNSEILKMDNFVYSIDNNKLFHLSNIESIELFFKKKKITKPETGLWGVPTTIEKSTVSSVKTALLIAFMQRKAEFISENIDYENKKILEKSEMKASLIRQLTMSEVYRTWNQDLLLELCDESEILLMMKSAIPITMGHISQEKKYDGVEGAKRSSRIRNSLTKMLTDIITDLKVKSNVVENSLEIQHHEILPAEELRIQKLDIFEVKKLYW